MDANNKFGVTVSKDFYKYFESLDNGCKAAFKIASVARSKYFDPKNFVEITLAKNLAERVVGLISIVAPQIKDSNLTDRIVELEEKWSSGDWRVGMQIALEVAQEKFCKFSDVREAMEVGIRIGFAYVTVGVVSAPLEGFDSLELKKRRDGKGEYFCLHYAGPIRNAGGTAAATSVVIADYVRVHMGYVEYDPDEKEIKRTAAEIEDYHKWITNLQYFPFKEESEFMMKHLSVEISGPGTEKYEVSSALLKDLPRVPENRLRSGFCLLHSSCLPLKAPKVWKRLSKWGHEMGMEHWDWLGDYVHLQHDLKAKGSGSSSKKKENVKVKKKLYNIDPDYTFVKDLVGGRPVFCHPLRNGGFRLRYGRSRASGLSGQSISPATMSVLDDFIAIGTQLKVERPGKGAAFTPCDDLEGPIVKLKNGDCFRVNDFSKGKSVSKDIDEIVYLGDCLICYGDFMDRAHTLVPSGYCEEYWILELDKAIKSFFNLGVVDEADTWVGIRDFLKPYFSDIVKEFEKFGCVISESFLSDLFFKPIKTKVSLFEAYVFSKIFNIPMHPKFDFFWRSLEFEDYLIVIEALLNSNLILKDNFNDKFCTGVELIFEDSSMFEEGLNGKYLKSSRRKRVFELLGLEHTVINSGCGFKLVDEEAVSFLLNVGIDCFSNDFFNKGNSYLDFVKSFVVNLKKSYDDYKISKYDKENDVFDLLDILELINLSSDIVFRDKVGIFIGGRMGRPEKAKMRKMNGSPHGLFPLGEQGGKMKTFKNAIDIGFVRSNFINYWCSDCERFNVSKFCFKCNKECIIRYYDRNGYSNVESEYSSKSSVRKVNIKELFDDALKKLNTSIYPDLIKGIKNTVHVDHIPENIMKSILRAKHGIFVNKDGTTRYDASEVSLTHFKPKEVGVSWQKIKSLGYEKDVYGNELLNDDQVLELKCQDIVLPCCPNNGEMPADEAMFRVGNFVDDLLVNLYGLEPFYNFKSKEDVVGHFIIGLAPHTSAGIIGRIIGFTQSQGLLAHPLYHSANRRDCDGDELGFMMMMDAFLNFSVNYLPASRGSSMDAPIVLTSILNPAEVDDMVFNMDIVFKYPLAFYEACQQYKKPWDVKIKLINDCLGKECQYEGSGFTHDTDNWNTGVLCSSYKTLPSMNDKVMGQMEIARRIRAVDTSDVARLIIEKHFVRDTKGNLRKYFKQSFRCPNCNTIYRRPPLSGKCLNCGGSKIIFTISYGSVVKYLDYELDLAKNYNLDPYLKQTLELLKQRVDMNFGVETEKQEMLNKWF